MSTTVLALSAWGGRVLLACLSLVVAASLAACDDGADDELFPRVVSLGDGEIFANVANSSLAVGPNRFMLQLEDDTETPILGADVHLRFYDLNDAEPALTAEADARFVPIELGYIDEHAPEAPSRNRAGPLAFTSRTSTSPATAIGVCESR